MPGETETTLREKLGSSAGTSAWTAGGGSSNYNHGTGQNSQNNYWQKEEDEAWESQVQTGDNNIYAQLKDTYTPPSQVYGPGQIDQNVTDERYNYVDLSKMGWWDKEGKNLRTLLSGLSPETLSAFGYDPKNPYKISAELYKMIGEGSLVNTLDYYADKDPNKEGIQFGNEAFTGTWSDLEKGVHGFFPGGTKQYYKEMSIPTTILPHTGGGGGWGSGWGSGGGYGGGGGSGGGGGYGISGQQDQIPQGYQRGQVGPGSLQEQVNQIYLGMSNLNAAPGFNKNRGGIVSLVQ
jgi:hypothetical protein